MSDTIVPDVIQRSFLIKVLLGVATVLVLTGLVGGLFYLDITGDLEDQVDRQVEATTVHHENAYDTWFGDRLDDVSGAAEMLEEEGELDDPNRIAGLLSQHEAYGEEIRNYYFVDLDTGEVVAGTDQGFVGMTIDDLGYEREWFEEEQFVMPGQEQAPDGEPVMAVGAHLLLTDAVVIGEIHAQDVGPRLEQSFRGAGTGVVTDEGMIVHGNEPAAEMSQIDPDATVTTTTTDTDIYAYRAMDSYPSLYVVTETPKESAFEISDAVVQNFGLTLLFAFIILIGVTVVGGRSALRDLETLAERAKAMGEGDLDVDLETNRKDEIGVLYTQFDEMRVDLKERIRETEEARKEAEGARKEAEVARAEAEEMAEYLQDKAEEYSQIMQEVGMGDLTQRMTKDGEEESMDRIAEEFNEMIEELEKTTGQLKSYVDEVEEAGAEVEQSADTVRDASEQVADSIQKISDDAYDQKERLQGVSETMDRITDDLETIADENEDVDIERPLEHIRDVAGDVSEIADLSEETMAESEHVAGAAEEQAAELNEVSERANDLQRYAQPLRDILGRFETEAEHEFVFSVGPTGGAESPGSRRPDDE